MLNVSKRKIEELREADYNPRIISTKRLENLNNSLNTYGDLSGIVFNVHTKTLISGHQRLKNFRSNGKNVRIETKQVTDAFGTVAEGYVVVKTDAGTLRIPYREVKWSDKKAEMAANIAANARGGDFDNGKLAILLDKLQTSRKFDVDVLGIDPLTAKKLLATVNLPTLKNGQVDDSEDDDASFPEYGEDSFDFEHTCPKCKFQYNTSAAKKPVKPEAKAPKLAAAIDKGKKVKSKDKTSKVKEIKDVKKKTKAKK